ncbi:MAG: hypothetical protein AAF578_05665 [Pseudomonadota bacterium]
MNEAMKPDRRGRVQLLLLALVFFGPLVVAIALYFGGGMKDAQVNYGTLIEPPITLEAKQHFDLGVRGRWTLLYVGRQTCDEECQNALVDIRQIRLATGREIDRIERMVWTEVPLGSTILDEHPGLVALTPTSETATALERALLQLDAGHIYIIDPIGNIILEYTTNPDRKALLKDLRKLLKLSRIG